MVETRWKGRGALGVVGGGDRDRRTEIHPGWTWLLDGCWEQCPLHVHLDQQRCCWAARPPEGGHLPKSLKGPLGPGDASLELLSGAEVGGGITLDLDPSQG